MPAHAMCPDHSQGRAGPPVARVAFARLCWASRCPRGVCPCVLGQGGCAPGSSASFSSELPAFPRSARLVMSYVTETSWMEGDELRRALCTRSPGSGAGALEALHSAPGQR